MAKFVLFVDTLNPFMVNSDNDLIYGQDDHAFSKKDHCSSNRSNINFEEKKVLKSMYVVKENKKNLYKYISN